ncbi:MAG: hypothetical protein J0H14_02710 [Alphaproteobacteria bacterium]|nr:hypothetical protein [Alphaproteobacteria bacterium]
MTNTGVIAADGGTITLTAQAADGIVQNLVSAGGKLRANSVGDKTGTIRVAGIGGSVTIEGAATAEGAAPGTRGGQIELAASNAVRVASGATVNASGRAGGGTVAVGTTLAHARGDATAKSARTAKSTVVESGATIRADATSKGDGGRVVLLSTEKTDHAGTITARSGAQGGNGGFVEVSGDQGFALTGSVDLAAPAGHVGSLLIDPADLVVVHGNANSGSLDKTAQTNAGKSQTTIAFSDDVPPNTISDTTINTIGLNANVTLQATNSLTVDGTAAATGAAVVHLANHALTLQSAGTLTLQSGSNLTATTITLDGGPGLTSIGGTLHGTMSIVLTTAGDVTQPAGAMTTPLLTGTVGGSLQLAGSANQIDALGNLTVNGGNFTLVNSVPLTVSGPVQATQSRAIIDITDTAGPASPGTSITAISINNGQLLAGALDPASPALDGTVTLRTTRAGADVLEPGGTINAHVLTGSVAGALTLNDPSNVIDQLGSVIVNGGDFALVDSVPVTVNGPVMATRSGANVTITDGAPSSAGPNGITISGPLIVGATPPSDAPPSGILEFFTQPGMNVIETTNGAITTGWLGGHIGGALILRDGTNEIAAIGAPSGLTVDGGNPGLGYLTIKDRVPLVVNGTVEAKANNAVIDITDTAGPAAPATSIAAISIAGGQLLAGASTLPHPTLDGTVRLATTQAGADVLEPAGTVNAKFLTGSVGGALHLANTGNIIDQLGNLTISGGDFTLADSVPLTVSGTVKATQFGAYVGITDLATPSPANGTAGITVSGSLTAGSTPPSDAKPNQPSPTGTLELVTQPGMDVIEPSSGIIVTGWLGGTIGGALSLNGTANQIAAIGEPFGLIVNGGNLTLMDSVPLTVNRNVEATKSGAVIDITDTFAPRGQLLAAISIENGQLLAGAPTVPGPTLDGTVRLTTTQLGADVEEPRGTINAHLLEGSVNGSLHLADWSNIIDQLGILTINGDFTLVDSVPLTVIGPVHAIPLGAYVGITDIALPLLGQAGITIDGSLTAGTLPPSDTVPHQPGPTGTLELFTFGSDVFETFKGSVTTGWLGGAINGSLLLNNGNNDISAIGAPFGLSVRGGNFFLADNAKLVVNGKVEATFPNAVIDIIDTAGPGSSTSPITAISIKGGSLSAGRFLPPDPNADGTVVLTTTQPYADVTEPNGYIAAHILEGSIGGSLHLSNPGNRIDRIGSVLGLVAGGDLTFRDSLPVTADGLVKAGDGRLLQLMAPSITLDPGGVLTANASVASTGPTTFDVTPGVIALQADAMSLAFGTINAPDGRVAIAPLNHLMLPSGIILSLDPIKDTDPTHLSLTQADLDSIHTLGSTTGPLGTQTLTLGSLDGVKPDPNTAQLQINTNLYQFGGIARTLELLSAGDITETAGGTPGGVAVTVLTGAAPRGNIDLSGPNQIGINSPNQIGEIGNLVTVGAYTATAPHPIGGLSTSGDLLLVNRQNLDVLTSVQAGKYAEIDVLPGDLSVTGSVTAGNVLLRAGDSSISGNVAINGSVAATNGEADLVAGMSYTPGTFHPAPQFTLGATAPGSAGRIAINGSINGGTVGLYSANDTVETGSITAGLLTGQAGVPPNGQGFAETLGNVSLIGATAASNQIATLGSYLATGGFLLNDGQALTVLGAVNSGTASTRTPNVQPQPYGATINVPNNALTIDGSVTAGVPFSGTPTLPGGDVTLNAGSITLAGAVGAPRTSGAVIAAAGANGGGTVSLTADTTIFEDALGYLQAVMLTGSSGNAAGSGAGTGSTILFGGAPGTRNANAIGSLGAFTTNVNTARTGDFSLQDGQSLTVTGPVNANSGSATIAAHAGPDAAGNPTTGDLGTNAPVRASANVNLLADGTITDNGGVSASNDANLTAGASIFNNALISSGLASALTALGRDITDQGGVSAGTTASLTANGTIMQKAGTITAAGTGNAVTLVATTGAIQQLAGATISASNPGGTVRLTAGTSIADAGIITSGADALLTAQAGDIGVSGQGVHAGGNATLLANTSILDTGGVTAGQAAALTATNGGITENAGVTAGTTATLTAGAAIATNGAITARTDAILAAGTDITDNGGITATSGNAGLTAGASIFNNALVTSGLASTLTATGGNITDQGGVTAGGAASLTASGNIAQNGATITAAGTGVTLTAQGGAITQASGATISATNATGTVTLNAAQGIALGGTLAATGSGAGVTLATQNGDITETNGGNRSGLIDATFLTGSAGGNAALDNPGNRIGTLGAFAARGGALTLADGQALNITGPVSAATSATISDPANVTIAPSGSVTAPSVNLTAADIGIQGSVAGASTVNLVATNAGITETGALTAGTLTISAPGTVALSGATALANHVAILGNVTAGNLTLVDGESLLIAGTISAPSIHIDDNGFALSMANGTTIRTDGVARPLGTVQFATLPTYAQGAPGAYFRAGSFQQVGTDTVAPLNGGPTTFRIDITSANGSVMFSPSGGLTANTTDLIVDLTGGTLGGLIFVKTLDLRYVPGVGNADLSGTVNGLGGPPAAGLSYITPLPNPKYQINGCPITAVNCILLSVASVPVINPLQDIYLGVLGSPQDDDDLLLPDVSERDY